MNLRQHQQKTLEAIDGIIAGSGVTKEEDYHEGNRP
jgi:hypothetical protein